MYLLRTVAIATALTTFGLTGCAQMPVGHDTQRPDAASTKKMSMDGSDAQLARMDEQMTVMQAMHDKMMEARTPEERSAMMAEHKKVMQNSMTMMGEMGSGDMMDKGDMKDKPDMQDKDPMHGDMGNHHKIMEKRMQMMQSMMQMMTDHMAASSNKS
ncbi:hypothetical protein [Granulosicoccus antarcticus]|uniref:Uncharacterized protein n=1 Tax=Granulosicoccus antarcticus IMCC3135 TaxID=1192854 RepID=A0A2Z2P1C8_9GAMM|nr:hypothetical protein [Granulosicoccus antarcticus]ASJ73364.1 hypothetical protein IMCC3135_16410 [Granulosicoccus antarcticus IMCC3135]